MTTFSSSPYRKYLPRTRTNLGRPTAVAAYILGSYLIVRELVIGTRAGVLLLLMPIVLIAIDRFPRQAIIAVIPIPLLDGPLLSGWGSFRLPAAVLPVFALGLLTRRWRVLPFFHATLAVLSTLLIVSLALHQRSPSTVSPTNDLMTLMVSLALCGVAASIRPRIDIVLAAIGTAGALTALVILTGLSANDRSFYALDSASVERVTTLGLNPNYLGIVLSMGIVAMVGLGLHKRNPLIVAVCLPSLAALPAIKSRSSLLLLAVGMFFVIFVGRGMRTRFIAVAAIALALLIAPTILDATYRAALGGRVSADLSQSDSVRAAAARLAVAEAVQHPLLGIGYGEFPSRAEADPSIGFEINTHNDYLRLAAEAGVAALALLLVLFGTALKSMRRLPFGTTATAVLMVYCFALLTANVMSNPAASLGAWVLIGASVGAEQKARRVRQECARGSV